MVMYEVTNPVEVLFPSIEDIRVEYKETGHKISPPYEGLIVYTKDDLVLRIACGRPRCNEGGYKLQSIITRMVLKKETTHQELVGCNGYTGSRKAGRSCLNVLELKINIKYRETTS